MSMSPGGERGGVSDGPGVADNLVRGLSDLRESGSRLPPGVAGSAGPAQKILCRDDMLENFPNLASVGYRLRKPSCSPRLSRKS